MENFFEFVRANSLPVYDLSLGFQGIPLSPGVYLLYDNEGRFIYVGKASNLRHIVAAHFMPSEDNLRIRMFATATIYQVTSSVEDAESLEGSIFDQWVRKTGQYPFANRVAPPRSMLTTMERWKIQQQNLLMNT
jgi:hypothetical protein